MAGTQIKELKCCPGCGRANNPITTKKIGVYSNGSSTLYKAPWCRPRCKPLSRAEKLDPQIREFWTRISPAQYNLLDEDIVGLVRRVRSKGFDTLFSCSGHEVHKAYLVFLDKLDRNSMVSMLRDYAPVKKNMKHHILGEIYAVYFNLPRGGFSRNAPAPV